MRGVRFVGTRPLLEVETEYVSRVLLFGFLAVAQDDHLARALERDALVFHPKCGAFAQTGNRHLLVDSKILVDSHLARFAAVTDGVVDFRWIGVDVVRVDLEGYQIEALEAQINRSA